MSSLHPKTVALLEAADAFADAPANNDDKETTRLRNAAMDWWHAGRPNLTTPTPDRLAELEARVAALERAQQPAPAPEPPRFVPTEPGWYWMRLTDGQVAVRWYDASAFAKGLDGWLAPVAPYAPPTRTADEARAKPMRGDRWATRMGRKYTLTRPPAEGCSGWFACWEGMEEGYGFSPGFPDETYLGNFAHELDGL